MASQPRTLQIYGLAFSAPFLLIFSVFVAYPIALEITLSFLYKPIIGPAQLSLRNFSKVFNDPVYIRALYNTLLYVGIAVNVKMFLAFLVSSILTIKHKGIKIFNALYLLPWTLPMVPAVVTVNWMLQREVGVVNAILSSFGFERINWLGQYNTAMLAIILFHIWKFMPFWTVVFYSGRMSIPQELYESAVIDGAPKRAIFRHVTLPLLSNLYLICTLISTIWVLGEFVIVWLLTRGGPADSTHVLSTLAYRYGFWIGNLNVAAASLVSILPLLLALIFLVLKYFRTLR